MAFIRATRSIKFQNAVIALSGSRSPPPVPPLLVTTHPRLSLWVYLSWACQTSGTHTVRGLSVWLFHLTEGFRARLHCSRDRYFVAFYGVTLHSVDRVRFVYSFISPWTLWLL